MHAWAHSEPCAWPFTKGKYVSKYFVGWTWYRSITLISDTSGPFLVKGSIILLSMHPLTTVLSSIIEKYLACLQILALVEQVKWQGWVKIKVLHSPCMHSPLCNRYMRGKMHAVGLAPTDTKITPWSLVIFLLTLQKLRVSSQRWHRNFLTLRQGFSRRADQCMNICLRWKTETMQEHIDLPSPIRDLFPDNSDLPAAVPWLLKQPGKGISVLGPTGF